MLLAAPPWLGLKKSWKHGSKSSVWHLACEFAGGGALRDMLYHSQTVACLHEDTSFCVPWRVCYVISQRDELFVLPTVFCEEKKYRGFVLARLVALFPTTKSRLSSKPTYFERRNFEDHVLHSVQPILNKLRKVEPLCTP